MTTSSNSSTSSPLEDNFPLPDAGRLSWSDAAPKRLKSLASGCGSLEAWDGWGAHLSNRKKPKPPSELISEKQSPLLWGLPDDVVDETVRARIKLLWKITRGKGKGKILRVLEEWDFASQSLLVRGLETLAWCYALHAIPRCSGALNQEAWLRLLGALIDAAAWAGETLEPENDPVAYQMLRGEAPLVLAGFLPEIQACQELADVAGQAVDQCGTEALLDGQGLPHARELKHLRPLLACWTRSLSLDRHFNLKQWSDGAAIQYEWMIREALRATASSGKQVFSDVDDRLSPEMLEHAMRLGGNEEDRRIANLVLPRRVGTKLPRKRTRLPEAFNHSEWAEIAFLRDSWPAAGTLLTADYADSMVHTELSHRGELFWSGEWTLDVEFSGVPARLESNWECVLWYADE
ncbi:MAG: hypothetical protein N2C14_00390, partial [Planctomycetales bacterium]